MKKREFFSKGLYLESIRRLMLPGMIFLVILALEAILIPIGYVINSNNYDSAPDIIHMIGVHPFIVASFFLITPILTWVAFSYLNKRNASDYYHALPHSRLAMYTSRVAAIVTWVSAIIVIPTLISATLTYFIRDIVCVMAGTYMQMAIGCFAASLFVIGAMVCAMSITGTAFSNVVVSLLIMFMPRYVMMLMSWFVAQKFPLIPEAYISGFLTPKLNIISGIFMGWFIDSDSINSIVTPSSQIYTICAGLFYLIIGAVLFKDRQSESADRSAPSHFMQAVYRIALTMCVCIPITCVCFIVWREVNSSEIFLIFVLYLIALLVYCIYELVTTKKFKSLVKALPGLIVVVLLNVALLISLTAITSAEIGFEPEPEDIEYIQIVNDYNYSSSHMDIYHFFMNESSKIKITDDEAIRVVSEALTRSINCTIDRDIPDSSYVNDYYDWNRYTVKINTGLNSEYRYIRMSNMDYKIVSKALSNHEKYAATWLTLPEAQKDTVYFDLGGATIIDNAYEVFRVMKDEVKILRFEDWHTFLADEKYSNFATVTYATNGCTVTVPVSAQLMPKTTACILKKAYETNPKELTSDLSKLKDILSDLKRIGYMYLFTLDKNGEYRQDYIDIYEGNITEISELIAEGEINNGDNFVQLHYFDYVDSEYDHIIDRTISRDMFIKLDDGIKDILNEFVGEEFYKYYD